MKRASAILIMIIFLLTNLNSAFAISDVYCDWENDAGNTLCYYSGHWADLSSRDCSPYMIRDTDYDDIKGDADVGCPSTCATCKYEEEDAYGVVGIDGYLNSLTDLDVAFAGGAMDWFGGWCSSGSNCNIYEAEMWCDTSKEYDDDPCIGWCSNFKDNSEDCTISPSTPTGSYDLEVRGTVNTEDENSDPWTEYMYGHHYIYLDCTDDGDCSGGRTCQVDGGGQGTTCNCIQISGPCNSCLDLSNGNDCDCYQECANIWCWGNGVNDYQCASNCAPDGKYTYQSSECCNDWNSETKQCYSNVPDIGVSPDPLVFNIGQ